jgi:hypothetical protein
MPDPSMAREMHDLRARLEDMETAQRCTVGVGDLSDSKSKMRSDMKEKRSQQKMQQMNACLELLQEWVQEPKWTFQFMRETWMPKSF